MSTVIESRDLPEIASSTCEADLRAEYDEITARIERAPVISTLHAYAILAAVAIARVAVLEGER